MPPTILLVDDFSDDREMYSEYFRFAGFETLQASNVKDALTITVESHPVVIVTDICLGGRSNGLELARHVKADTRLAAIRIIALSALPMDYVGQRMETSACDLVLSKPCAPHTLASHVRELLATRPVLNLL